MTYIDRCYLVKIISEEISQYINNNFTKSYKNYINNWESLSGSNYDLGGELKIFTEKLKLNNMDVIIGKFKKGERLKNHYHKYPTEEIYFILDGEAEVNINGDIIIAKKGDILSVKSEIPHFPKNIHEKLLWILFVLSPIERSPLIILE